MSHAAHARYFESLVQTATPQRLRLLLIEGAIRFARRALDCWETSPSEATLEALDRCRGILAELLSGVRPDGSPLAREVAALYAFLFQHLSEAELRRDAKQVEQVIEVLEVERETWQQVCAELPEAPASAEARPAEREISAAGLAPIFSTALARPGLPAGAAAVSRFSMEG